MAGISLPAGAARQCARDVRTMHGRHPDGPRPSASGSGLALVCPPANQGTRRGEGRSRSGREKNSKLWEGGEERGRAREAMRGQWNGVGDGVCSAAPMEESLERERERERVREGGRARWVW